MSQPSPLLLPMIRESNIGLAQSLEIADPSVGKEERLLHQLQANLEMRMSQKQLEDTFKSQQSFSGLDRQVVKEIVEHRQSQKKGKKLKVPAIKPKPKAEA